jgi:hypothetical protein
MKSTAGVFITSLRMSEVHDDLDRVLFANRDDDSDFDRESEEYVGTSHSMRLSQPLSLTNTAMLGGSAIGRREMTDEEEEESLVIVTIRVL